MRQSALRAPASRDARRPPSPLPYVVPDPLRDQRRPPLGSARTLADASLDRRVMVVKVFVAELAEGLGDDVMPIGRHVAR